MKRKNKQWKPKKYLIINEYKGIEFETHHKNIALDFLEKVSEGTSTNYYILEKIDD